MAWKSQQEDQHLKLEWSAPMSGLDTTALAPYVQGLVDLENFLIQNQSYIASTWAPVSFGDVGLSWTTQTLIGFGELGFPIAISGATNVEDQFFYVVLDSSGNIAARVSDNIETATGGDLPGSPLATLGSPIQGTLSWKTINNTTYISAPGMSQIFQIGPDGSGNLTFSLLTSYLGCKFLGEFNGRLIALNVSQWTTSGGVSFAQNFPYQFAWSAAGQQYGIWNPLDMSSNATGAGFNNLPDVEDEITGALFIGPTIYCIRRAGITEVTALNSGIQPFNFDHMWASHKGVGTVFPETIAQYGPKGAFVAKDDIYSLGLDGISTFGGSAKNAIYTDLQAASVIQSTMVALTINGAPELCYILALQIANSTTSTYIVRTYIYGFESKQWMRLTFTTTSTANFVSITSLLLSNIINTTFSDNVSCDGVAIATQVPGSAPLWFYIPLAPSNSAALGNANQSQLTFPPARIQTFKDITIDAVGFYAEGTTGAVFQPIVDGIQFTEQTIGTGPDAEKNLYTSYPLNQASTTSLQPALVVEASGTIAFGEISLYGTIGPGRRP